jgi:flagellar hook-associated protein 2
MALTLPGISSTGTLSAPGVGSGLDIKGLVSQLMAVEQQPLTQLATQEAKYQAKLSSLGAIKGALASLQSAAQALATASTASYSASVSDSSVLSATAGSSAVAGNYSVSVDGSKLAQGQKLVAPGKASTSAAIGTGASTTLTITLGTITGGPPVSGQYANADFTADPARTPVSLTIDAGNNTLAGIRDAINAANAGVSASIINDGGGLPYHLALTSNDTGAASSMKLSVSGDADIGALLGYDPHAAPQTFSETQSAQNAQFTVDGVAITSATNTVTDAIPGVSLTLANRPGINTVTVALARTGGSLNSALGSLVSAYNAANAAITGATAKGAVMQGEGGVVSLQRQIRAILGGTQPTGGAYTTLSQLGVGFQADGSLKLDSLKLGAALSANIGAVSSLAAAIGAALKSAADGMLGAAGPITSKTDSINRSITDIGARRAHLQDRLAAVQARYQKQFSGLETLISSMNKTSQYLTQQLASLPGFTTK